MRITHVELKNWRNFQRADLDVGQRLFIVGPNAAGKSNFLDAIRFLRDLTVDGGGLQQALHTRGGMRRVRNLAAGAYNHGRVKIAVTLGDDKAEDQWKYSLEITTKQMGGHRRPVVHSEIVQEDGSVILERPNEEDLDDPERLTQTHLEQVSANRAFRRVAEFFATTRYLHLVPQLIREPDRRAERVDDPYGGDFLKQVARTPVKKRTTALKRINRALQIAVPQLDELTLQPDEDGLPHLEARYQHWRKDGARQDEQDFSDGTLRLIGLLWVLGEEGPANQGPVLLEEPEMSLHSSIVGLLPTMLSAAQQRTRRQVFVSTHAAEILRDEGLGLDEVALLTPSTKGTIAVLASDVEDIREEVEELGLSLAETLPSITEPEQLNLLANIAWG